MIEGSTLIEARIMDNLVKGYVYIMGTLEDPPSGCAAVSIMRTDRWLTVLP